LISIKHGSTNSRLLKVPKLSIAEHFLGRLSPSARKTAAGLCCEGEVRGAAFKRRPLLSEPGKAAIAQPFRDGLERPLPLPCVLLQRAETDDD
jgi:hypothetical protein